jgi:hypothetical protein
VAIQEVNQGAFGEIRLEGAAEFIDRLVKYERKDLKTALFKEMKQIATPIIKDVQALLPTQQDTLSGWGGANTSSQVNVGPNERWPASRSTGGGFPVYYEKSAKAGVKSKVGGRTRSRGSTFYINLLSIIQGDGAGVVFEFAGSKTNNNFAKGLNSAGFGVQPRALFKGVDNNKKAVQKAIKDAIISAEIKFNSETKRFG